MWFLCGFVIVFAGTDCSSIHPQFLSVLKVVMAVSLTAICLVVLQQAPSDSRPNDAVRRRNNLSLSLSAHPLKTHFPSYEIAPFLQPTWWTSLVSIWQSKHCSILDFIMFSNAKKYSQNSKKKNCGNFFFFFFFNFHRNFQNMKMALSMFWSRVVLATLDHMLHCACLKKATVLP